MDVELTAAGPERPPERSANRSVNNDRHAGSTAFNILGTPMRNASMGWLESNRTPHSLK